jgi:hypothetical protein
MRAFELITSLCKDLLGTVTLNGGSLVMIYGKNSKHLELRSGG